MKQPADSSHQQRRVKELNSVVRQLLAPGPVDLDSRRAGGQLPMVSMAVIRDEYVEPQCKIYYLTVRQLSGYNNDSAGEGCDASGLSLSSYSAEEIAKKQRNEPVFHWLINSVESGDVLSEN